ncbi:MAG: metallophosphoesterase, partial [Elusimicrobia bacterium]|nr:metallophosphoesterase [Elusimicrobiota bacterium]
MQGFLVVGLLAAAVSASAQRTIPQTVRAVGLVGPGVTPAHLEAVSLLAEQTGQAWLIHGSRQTGTNRFTGLPFSVAADLDLGVVGTPEVLTSAQTVPWDGIAHVQHGPTLSVPTVEEAVGRGYLVVAPAVPIAPGRLGALQRQSRQWRTDGQLSRLANLPPPADSFQFAVIGDAEPGRFLHSRVLFNKPGVFWKILPQADASGADFIFQIGDMVSRGTIARFARFFQGLRRSGLTTPFLTTPGNHDRHRPHGVSNDRVYRSVFGNSNYVFERGGWRFVAVDTSARRLLPAQLEWLKGVLDPAVPTVVFTHVPPAPLGEWTDFGVLKGVGGFKTGAQEFMRLMSERKVARVYMGHVHGLGVLERDGVRYVLTGGGGSPLYPGPVKKRLHHWLSIEAKP